ncbi:orotate phosphoribosyltransferase [Sorochytrium milnesiophthora]
MVAIRDLEEQRGAEQQQQASSSYKQDYIRFCLDSGVLQFGSFTLKSGRCSPYFLNAGRFDTGQALATVGSFYADAVLDHAATFQHDVLFGPAYKGIPLVTATAVALANKGHSFPYAFNRKEAKDHGEGGSLVGASLAGKRVLIVDDVITAGTAIRECFPILEAAGATVAGVLVAVDRMEVAGNNTGKSAIQEVQESMGVPVRAIVTMDDIMEYLEQQGDREDVLSQMKQYREQYGIKA